RPALAGLTWPLMRPPRRRQGLRISAPLMGGADIRNDAGRGRAGARAGWGGRGWGRGVRRGQLSSVSQTDWRWGTPEASATVRSKRMRARRPSNSRAESMLWNQEPRVIRHRSLVLGTPA